MPTDAADSRGDWVLRVPFEAQLGFALVFLAYGVAGFIDIIEYQPSAVLWLAASAGLFGYAVHRLRQS